MLQTIINAFYVTMELWIFLAILLTALVVEAIINNINNSNRSEDYGIYYSKGRGGYPR